MSPHLSDIVSLFVILCFFHFWADWAFQSHEMATKKSSDWKLRALHCFEYTFWIALGLNYLKLAHWGQASTWVALAVLFVSHFLEDTYLPIYWWAKYVRRMPSLLRFDLPIAEREASSREAFKEEWNKPISPILFITMDQMIHISFLWLVARILL